MDKKKIVNSLKNLINEAVQSKHYQERLYDRFLNKSELVVGYEIPGTRGEYEEVGTYVLPASIKQQILENAKLVENYNFPKSKSYGIQLAYLPIDKNLIKYYSEDARNQIGNKPLLFLDKQTESNGNLIFAIIRGNEIYTIYFAKSYVSQDTSKLRVDAIIKNLNAIKQNKVR